MDIWKGEIELPDGGAIPDIELVATHDAAPTLDRISLRFLAVVDVSRIPLFLAISPPLEVYSQSQVTQNWFCALLLGGHGLEKDAEHWWEQASTIQSPLGILAQIQRETTNSASPTATEMLFYAHNPGLLADATSSPADASALTIHAIPLSSDLLRKHPPVSTPPQSPDASLPSGDSPIDGEFLPALFPDPGETQHSRKRQSVSSLFDEATERRKRARRKGGESIAAAAAASKPTNAPTLPLQHRRSVSDAFDPGRDAPSRPSSTDGVRNHGRTLSRSPSLSLSGDAVGVSSRKGSLLEGGKRTASGLSRVTSVADELGAGGSQEQSVESRNKDTVSRLVMAGMRMYGLQQRKKATARKGSITGAEEAVTPEDAARDEEYKLVYHQAYRGTVFAMRNYIATEPLALRMEQLREIVDKLLAIFCTDPLAMPLPVEHSSAAVTPAAQQPFGTPTAGVEGSPFAQRGGHFGNAVSLSGAKVHTPVIRRQGG
ncbi:hypothetical protein B0J12DRAFT_651753 [Macrophomina phaseolina]|uniref:Sld7 C-terminal domain-containing protein n=1 Tax=Macrophomina phaseolina TaxID=35725 RepID=A0ABQ8GKF4_9PEZI|nr:hypothetical protein B0J12DRAFT_651753 [Macrophomina phaseolina]